MKLDKNLLKNVWVLAGLLLVAAFAISQMLSVLVRTVGISAPSAVSLVVAFAAAFSVGSIYTYYFKEIVPKELRRNATIIFMVLQLIASLLYVFAVPDISSVLGTGLTIVLVLVGTIIGAVVIYWALGFGGKQYLKSLERKKGK